MGDPLRSSRFGLLKHFYCASAALAVSVCLSPWAALGATLSGAPKVAPKVTPVALRQVSVSAATTLAGARVWLDLSASAKHQTFTLDNPPRIVVDLSGVQPVAGLALPATAVLDGAVAVRAVRIAPRGDGTRVVIDLTAPTAHHARALVGSAPPGARVEIEIGAPLRAAATLAAKPEPIKTEPIKMEPVKTEPLKTEPVKLAPVRLATREPRSGRDLMIAIDAGHGGKDPGAIGSHGTREKDVTLAVARCLADALNQEPGMRAYLVRDGDYFIELRQRMVRARKAGADLFVSIHADSAPNHAAEGSSIYILSPRGASSEAARWLANRENAADLAGNVKLDGLEPIVASVLMDLSQGDTISSSDRAARQVLEELDRIGNVHKREVQAAGFMVLKSPDIPSLLVETAFISHPEEERRLADPEHQQLLATAIQNGLRNYFHANPPPGTRIAQLVAARRRVSTSLAAIAGP
jgi:N-acetylmuramoyl-L-alanine amidase